jgi:hypothetical protein
MVKKHDSTSAVHPSTEAPRLRRFAITICDPCIRIQGQQCHTPGCVFIRQTMAEVAESLDALLIRPVLNGVREQEPFGEIDDAGQPITVEG